MLEKARRFRDGAQEALVAAKKALRKEEERKERLVQELERLRAERFEARRRRQAEMLEQGMSGMGATRVESFVQGTERKETAKEEEIREQEQVIEKALLRVDEQKMILTEAAQKVQGFEKAKEKWLDQVRKEIAAKEAKEQDEIGTISHLRRMRERGG